MLVCLLGLASVGTAQANRNILYGVNDANFARNWSELAPRVTELGIDQVGLWARYSCARDTNEDDVRLSEVPEGQPVMLQLYGDPNCTPHTSAERQAYVNRAVEIASDYPNIRELQVWNEPDLRFFWQGTASEYVLLLAAVHAAFWGSGVKIIGPGFSPHAFEPFYENRNFGLVDFARAARRYLRKHHQALIEGFAYHPYWGFGHSMTNRIARTLDRFWKGTAQPSPSTGLRFWWTETGIWSIAWPSECHNWARMCVSAEQQAARVTQIARLARQSPYVVADFNFQFQDNPGWAGGLIDEASKPKPAFYAFQAALARYR